MPPQLINQLLSILVLILTLIGGGFAIGNGGEGSSITPGETASSSHKVTQKELFDATNRYRVQQGVAPLAASPALDDVAQDWAETTARTGDFKHRSNLFAVYPAGMTGAGENILSVPPSDTAEQMVQAWSRSPGHRANMVNTNYTHLGIGVAQNSQGQYYLVQNFGTK